MFDRILLRSGQFILRKSKVEIDVDSFRILVEDALAEFNGFSPIDKTYNDVSFLGARSMTLDEDFDPAIGRAPSWLSIVRPIRSSSGGYFPYGKHRNSPHTELIDPIEAPWDFDIQSKILTVPFSDIYKITAVYDHVIVETDDPNSPGNILYSVPSITYQDLDFFRLLQGMFLQSIGRSRRAFTLNDLPILMDADTIASEGTELIEKAIEGLQDIQKIRLAWGE